MRVEIGQVYKDRDKRAGYRRVKVKSLFLNKDTSGRLRFNTWYAACETETGRIVSITKDNISRRFELVVQPGELTEKPSDLAFAMRGPC